MNKFNITVHSIFITVGPSGCGKSTFVNDVFVPSVKKALQSDSPTGGNVVVLSSDKIRFELLGDETQTKYSKYDSRLYEISEQAFQVLFNRLNALTSFPLNAEVVVVDTTGLSSSFRNKILEIAEKNHYKVGAIVFSYRNIEDYFKYCGDTTVTRNHIRNMNESAVQELKTSLYPAGIIRLKKFTTKEDLEITINSFEYYQSCFLPNNYSYGIIGDLHESVDALKLVMEELRKKKNVNKFILVGDIWIKEMPRWKLWNSFKKI